MEDFKSRCRLCGRKEQNQKLTDIFENDPSISDYSNLDLPRKIKKLLPVVVIKWDPLPHVVCETCLDQLNKMDKFYDETICAEKFLKSLLPYSSPKPKTQKIKPIIKIQNFSRSNGFKMLEMEANTENEEKNSEKKDKETVSTQVVLCDDDSQEYNFVASEKSVLVDLVDEPLEEFTSVNKSPSGNKSPLVDLVDTDESLEGAISVEKLPNELPSVNKSPIVNEMDIDESAVNSASVAKSKKSNSANISPAALDINDSRFASTAKSSKRPPPDTKVPSIDESSAQSTSGAKSSKKSPPALRSLFPDPAPVDEPSEQSTSDAKSPKNPPSTPPFTSKPTKPIEIIDLIDTEEPVVPVPKKTLDCFFIQNKDKLNLYSCRQCYRTFLNSNSALSHVCEENETPEKQSPEESPEKTLPPLKIRVSTSSNGKHICELCKQSFGRKTALITHQKTVHFTVHDESSDFSEHIPKKKKKRKSKDGADLEDNGKSKRRKTLDEENLRPIDHHGAFNNNTSESVANEKSHQKIVKTNEKEENYKRNSFVECDLCEEVFLSRSSLEEHKKKHGSLPSGGKDGIFESDAYNLTSDEEVQKEEEFKESCIYCDKILTDRSELFEHQKNHLLSANILTPYDGCNRIEKKSDSDNNSSVNVYICTTCSVSFDRKSAYIAHKRIHDKVTDNLSDDDIIENSQD